METFGFQWHLTDRCNLRCRHCYQTDFTRASEQPKERLLAAVDRIFGALSDRPVEVNLTGGEPLLLPDLLPLVEKLHAFDNLEACHLITNGTVVRAPLVEAIRQFPKMRYLKVSLEAGDETINDAIRGAGSFRRVLSNLRVIRARTEKPVVFMVTLSKYNATAIGGVIRLAREVGAKGVIFERFVPLGQAAVLADQVLGPADWRHAVAAIVAEADIEAELESLLGYTAFWLSVDPGGGDRLSGAVCNLGAGSMALMPDGTIYPCRRLPVPVGNLFERSFADILAELSRFSPDRIAPRLLGPLCGACGVEGCAGCRAMARALSGDLYADDPACPLNDPDGC